jgi:gas vesicle protein
MEELMEENGSRGVGSIISSFFLGGLIGASVALLVSPKSGRETREQIKDLAGTATTKATDYYGQVKEAVSCTLENAKGLIDEKKRLITDAVQAGFAIYEQKKQEKTTQAPGMQGRGTMSGQESTAQPM